MTACFVKLVQVFYVYSYFSSFDELLESTHRLLQSFIPVHSTKQQTCGHERFASTLKTNRSFADDVARVVLVLDGGFPAVLDFHA